MLASGAKATPKGHPREDTGHLSSWREGANPDNGSHGHVGASPENCNREAACGESTRFSDINPPDHILERETVRPHSLSESDHANPFSRSPSEPCVGGSQTPLPDLPLEGHHPWLPAQGGRAPVHGPQDRGAVSGAAPSLSWCLWGPRVPGYLDCLPGKGTGRRHPAPKPNLPPSAMFQFLPSELKEGEAVVAQSGVESEEGRRVSLQLLCTCCFFGLFEMQRKRGVGASGEAVRSFSPQRAVSVTHRQLVIQLHSSITAARKGAWKPFNSKLSVG